MTDNGIGVVEQKVKGRGGSVNIRRENDNIQVVLANKTIRTFSSEKLERSLTDIALLSYDDIWIEIDDSSRNKLFIKFTKGRVFIEPEPTDSPECSVTWNLLQQAFDKALELQ